MLPPLRVPNDPRHGFWSYQGSQSPYPFQVPVYQQRNLAVNNQHTHHSHNLPHSAASDTLFTPTSASHTFAHAGTIQPSAFRSWQNDGRARGNTISGALLAGENQLRSTDSRVSTPPNGDLEDRRWEGSIVSPSISDQLSDTSGEDIQPESKYTAEINYITDSETKLSLAVSHLLILRASANV